MYIGIADREVKVSYEVTNTKSHLWMLFQSANESIALSSALWLAIKGSRNLS